MLSPLKVKQSTCPLKMIQFFMLMLMIDGLSQCLKLLQKKDKYPIMT